MSQTRKNFRYLTKKEFDQRKLDLPQYLEQLGLTEESILLIMGT